MDRFHIANSLSDSLANLDQLLHHAVQIAAAILRAERVVKFFVERVKLRVSRVRFGVWHEHMGFQSRHLALCHVVILMRSGDDCRRNSRAESASLRRATDLHRTPRHVCVNLHHQRTLLGDAAAVHHGRNLHAVFLEAIDDRQRAERRGLNECAVNFRWRRVKRLADERARESLIHEYGAIAVVPIQREQSTLTGLESLLDERERI